MIDFIDSTFEGGRIDLDGGRYTRCIFRRCELVYRGGLFHLDGCSFEESTFSFDDAAGRTLAFLQGLAASDGGAEIIDATFDFRLGAARTSLQ